MELELLKYVVVQFPIAGIVGGIAWYAYREVRTNNTAHTEREQKSHDAAIKALKATHDQAVTAVRKEMGGLLTEIEKLT